MFFLPSLLLAITVVVTVGPPVRAGDFDDTLAVQVEKRAHGPRSMPGDIVQLKDGTLLMSYTLNDIMGIKSTDRGKTWGKPFVLIAQPVPPAKGHYLIPGFLRLRNRDILLSGGLRELGLSLFCFPDGPIEWDIARSKQGTGAGIRTVGACPRRNVQCL